MKAINVTRVSCLVAVTLPFACFAQSAGMTDYETHLIRGMAQRNMAQMSYDKIAVEKGSSEAIRNLAKRALEVHTEAQQSVSEVGKKLGAWGAAGNGPPAGGGTPGAGGPPPGGGAGGPPSAGAAPAGGPPGGMGAGGPPGGNAKPPGGSFDDALNKASGEEFDRLYLYVSILQTEEMLRANALEIEASKTNPEIVAWSKAHIEPFRSVARAVQKAARGEDEKTDNPLERERGAADAPKK